MDKDSNGTASITKTRKNPVKFKGYIVLGALVGSIILVVYASILGGPTSLAIAGLIGAVLGAALAWIFQSLLSSETSGPRRAIYGGIAGGVIGSVAVIGFLTAVLNSQVFWSGNWIVLQIIVGFALGSPAGIYGGLLSSPNAALAYKVGARLTTVPVAALCILGVVILPLGNRLPIVDTTLALRLALIVWALSAMIVGGLMAGNLLRQKKLGDFPRGAMLGLGFVLSYLVIAGILPIVVIILMGLIFK